MTVAQSLLGFALRGADWVLWLLIGLSLLSITIIVERAIYFARHRFDIAAVRDSLAKLIHTRRLDEARQLLARSNTVEATVVLAGIAKIERGAHAVGQAMLSAKAEERPRLDRNLAVLGTLGNNSPFIGLFGTVLGIIKASHDLTAQQGGGGAAASAVMSGVFEALVATAVGLAVAIPAVVFFNYFQRQVRASLGRVDTLAHLVLAELGGEEG
jgi:biopolymer transport protein ExbB